MATKKQILDRNKRFSNLSKEEQRDELLDIAMGNLGKKVYKPKPVEEIKTTEDFMTEVFNILGS